MVALNNLDYVSKWTAMLINNSINGIKSFWSDSKDQEQVGAAQKRLKFKFLTGSGLRITKSILEKWIHVWSDSQINVADLVFYQIKEFGQEIKCDCMESLKIAHTW